MFRTGKTAPVATMLTSERILFPNSEEFCQKP